MPETPRQIPPRDPHFTGRVDLIDQLLRKVVPGAVVTLVGPGGIGKSALAAQVVSLLPIDQIFPDGIILHEFYRRPQADLALEHIIRSFGLDAEPPLLEKARRLLAGRQALFLLDGAEACDDLDRVLAMRGERCALLVSSRDRADAVAEMIEVLPLPPVEAMAVLRAWAGPFAADDTAVHAICNRVGGLPLAVRLIGRYLREHGEAAGDYLDWLNEQPLTALDQGQRGAQSVPRIMARSLAQVSDMAQKAMAVVGVLAAAPFTAGPVAAALAVPARQTGLGELVRFGLLRRDADHYEVAHALVHTFARRRLTAPEGTVERLSTYFQQLARQAEKRGGAGYPALDATRPHVVELLTQAEALGATDVICNLVYAYEQYVDLQGHFTEREALLEVGIRAAAAGERRSDEAEFLKRLGNAYADLGQVERAIDYYEQALAISRDIGDRRGEGADLGNLGNAYAALGQVERAIEHHEQALAIAREIGDRGNEAIQAWNLGLKLEESEPSRALELMSVCVDYEQEIGHPDAEADAERVAALRAKLAGS